MGVFYPERNTPIWVLFFLLLPALFVFQRLQETSPCARHDLKGLTRLASYSVRLLFQHNTRMEAMHLNSGQRNTPHTHTQTHDIPWKLAIYSVQKADLTFLKAFEKGLQEPTPC